MGLFNKLFGKKKTTDAEPVDKKALGLKYDAELATQTKAPKKAEEAPKAAAPKKVEETPKAEAPKKAEEAPPATTAEAAPKAQATPKAAPKKESAPKESEPKDTADEADALATSKESVSVGEGGGGRFEIKKSKDGRFVFNLYAKNHVIVATSQIYSSSTSAVGGIKSVIANAPIAAIEDQTLKNYEPQNFPKWEIYQDKGQQYRFRLSAPNGSCICHSQGYTNKTNCKNGIQSIIRSAKDASIDKIYLKKDGE